jgi:hypothetical protein
VSVGRVLAKMAESGFWGGGGSNWVSWGVSDGSKPIPDNGQLEWWWVVWGLAAARACGFGDWHSAIINVTVQSQFPVSEGGLLADFSVTR